MSEVIKINITKTSLSRINEQSLKDIPFGHCFTDHMLVADYADGKWQKVEIMPYQALHFDPSLAALHYGQSIFEGIKAFKEASGDISVFRPIENFNRFNHSAKRMQMPEVPESIFMDGMKTLINLDRAWVPEIEDHALYIRPFMFATDTYLGVRPSLTYKFIIILSPTGPYFSAPMRIYVEEKFTRAVAGGVGFAKNAGNYAASLHPAVKAKELGYDQVLWTDATEHKYLQEVGMMNVFFVINNQAITPSLEEGTILPGITRKSALQLLKDMGIEAVERRISIDELIEAYKAGQLTEVFGTGTAATISMIKALGYKDYLMEFDTEKATIAPALKIRLTSIQKGIDADTHGWLFKV